MNLIKLKTSEDDDWGSLNDQIERLRYRKNKLASVMKEFVKNEKIKKIIRDSE